MKASALAYTVLISLVLALMTLAAILAVQLHKKRIAGYIDARDAARNVESALVLMLSDSTIGTDDQKKFRLFDDSTDSVTIWRYVWGGFEVLCVEATCGRSSKTKAVLAGEELPDSPPVLWLSDNGRPLSLCGKTLIRGNCSLPKSGVKRAYIEGTSFIGETLIQGRQEVSGRWPDAHMPETEMFLSSEVIGDTAFGDFDLGTISFTAPAKSVSATARIVVQREMAGHILIQSDTEVLLTSEARVNGAIITAPTVRVETGFVGNVQIFADTILIDEDARLLYPSGLYSINPDRGHAIEIGKSSVIGGDILMFRPNGDPDVVKISAGGKVYGTVYTNGKTELSGSLFGCLVTKEFSLTTRSSHYTNHLLDATLDLEALPDYYIGRKREGKGSKQILVLP